MATTLTLRIDNMHCGSCIRRVTMALNAIPATHAEQVRIGSARITSEASPSDIQQSLTAAGYPAMIEAA